NETEKPQRGCAAGLGARRIENKTEEQLNLYPGDRKRAAVLFEFAPMGSHLSEHAREPHSDWADPPTRKAHRPRPRHSMQPNHEKPGALCPRWNRKPTLPPQGRQNGRQKSQTRGACRLGPSGGN